MALAQTVAAAIAARIPLAKDLVVLDFGCGTGLVARAVKFGTIAGADTSPGMLRELAAKAQAAGIPVQLLPLAEDGSGPHGGPYDLIVSSMTLHRAEDVLSLLHRLARHLAPGRQVALADLDAQNGSFHRTGLEIHHRGYSRDRIQAWPRAAGCEDIRIETAAITRKMERDYPVFLTTARRQKKY